MAYRVKSTTHRLTILPKELIAMVRERFPDVPEGAELHYKHSQLGPQAILSWAERSEQAAEAKGFKFCTHSYRGIRARCVRPDGHGGEHRATASIAWPTEESE